MVKISQKLQTEIVEYLYLDLNSLPKPIKLKPDSPKNDVIATSITRGIQIGMNRAIDIINAWNKPNKGKVSISI